VSIVLTFSGHFTEPNEFRNITRKPNGHFKRPFLPSPPLGFTNVSAILYLYELVWQKVWLCDTIFWLAGWRDVWTLMTQLIFLIAFISAEKRKFTRVECRYKFTHNWECLHRDDEIFTVVPRPWIQAVNISSRIKIWRLINTSSSRSSESGAR